MSFFRYVIIILVVAAVARLNCIFETMHPRAYGVNSIHTVYAHIARSGSIVLFGVELLFFYVLQPICANLWNEHNGDILSLASERDTCNNAHASIIPCA